MKKSIFQIALLLFVGSTVHGAGNNLLHKAPYDFLFGNHLDTHQETQENKNGTLKGRLYIIYTGEIDAASGLPIARHPRGADNNEECGVDAIDCKVGWLISAVPSQAKFLYHSGVAGEDHPVWMMGSRKDIPQRGHYTHYHWVTSDSTDDRMIDGIPAVCDVQKASQLQGDVTVGDLTLEGFTWEEAEVHTGSGAEDLVCPGWLLQLTAIRSFTFEHGGEKIPVTPGPDNSTHLNIVTNYAVVPDITGSGGGAH